MLSVRTGRSDGAGAGTPWALSYGRGRRGERSSQARHAVETPDGTSIRPSFGVSGGYHAGMDTPLTHLGPDGAPRMVDVGDKPLTRRVAVAEGRVRMSRTTRELALGAGGPKGPVLEIARLAGLTAAKRTADLVPLCHPLPIDAVAVAITPEGDDALSIRAEVATTWRTGVEMEAFTAVAAAGLTIIDMLKAVDRGLVLEGVRLLHKSGGRSGTWERGDDAGADG